MLPSRDAGGVRAASSARILCAVDGSLGSREAARQAIRLAHGSSSASLRFAAARHDRGRDPSLPSDLTEMQTRNALEYALAAAADAGCDAEVSLLRGRPVTELLLEAAGGFDLLALGGTRQSKGRAAHLGTTATRIAEEASCSVLLALPIGSRDVGGIFEIGSDPNRLGDRLREGSLATSGALLIRRRQPLFQHR